MNQAEKSQDFLKTERVVLFAFLSALMLGFLAASLQPRWQHIYYVIELCVGSWFLTLGLP